MYPSLLRKHSLSFNMCSKTVINNNHCSLSLSLSLSLCLLDFAPEHRHNGQNSTIPIRQQRHHLTLKKTTTATKSNQFLIRPSSPFDLPPRFKHAQNKNLRFFALLPITPPPSDPFPILWRFWRQRHSAAGAVVRGEEQRGGFGSSDGNKLGLRGRGRRLRPNPERWALLRPKQCAVYGVVCVQRLLPQAWLYRW